MVENVAAEDGGGYRIYFPTLGYAVYGVGDTLQEALESLAVSKHAYEEFLAVTPGYSPPAPKLEDVRESLAVIEMHDGFPQVCNNNYAYAA